MIKIELSNAEALVLHDWLERFLASESQPSFQDQAEVRVLSDIAASLEPQLDVLLSPDYITLLGKARDTVRDQE